MHLVMRYLCFFGIVKRQGVKRRMDKRNTSEEQKSGYLGLTRADEERHLADVISVAQQNLERAGAWTYARSTKTWRIFSRHTT